MVQEVVQEVGEWVSQTYRLYANSTELEIEWTVGPIPLGCVGFRQVGWREPSDNRFGVLLSGELPRFTFVI